MKFKFEKDLRIVIDLATHCHKLGAKDCHIDMKNADGVFDFFVSCTLENLPPDAVEELRTELGRPRQKEIEQNFWGLSGEVETECELTLIGMMIDTAEVSYDGRVLAISGQRLE